MRRDPRDGVGRRRPRGRAVGLVLAAVLCGGCGPADDDGPDGASAAVPDAAPSPDVEPTPAPAVADAAAVRTTGVPVVAGGTTVLHVLGSDPATAITAEPDGDVTTLTIDPGAVSAPVDVLLAAPEGATIDPQDDRSLVVRGVDGTFVGGAGRPAVGADAASPRVAADGDDLLRLQVTGPLTFRIGAVAVVSTDWGEREGGRSIAVEPSEWARDAGQAGEVAVWAELVELDPEVDTPVMHDQLVCHAVGAPDKATWNLEPWRPDVGLLRIMLAGCNPT
ncbi:DUF2599 domain-containing protein [Cellulomonas sp. ATA003]|uniref:DUF2599 domain-containing protein n=1 Tax=Cellulomonas sp. ATA003 TaxID=3073064 RepID=UPI002873A990|nr:DUF2599 domain-containing protein [Cellulomonas sp. ATA003]WNB85417.1 DUF2599 domain-containing protein [Cellulomonas sp. ATA003]